MSSLKFKSSKNHARRASPHFSTQTLDGQCDYVYLQHFSCLHFSLAAHTVCADVPRADSSEPGFALQNSVNSQALVVRGRVTVR